LSEIKASPEALRKFFHDCNTKHKVRADFLDNPIKTLRGDPYNIEIGKHAAKEILGYVEQLINEFGEDAISMLPVEWEGDHYWAMMKGDLKGLGIRIIGSDRGVIP
jgi:hypothetical protein